MPLSRRVSPEEAIRAVIMLRVVRGITDHFPTRVSEWALGAILFNWGWVLLRPANTFGTSPAYTGLAKMADEATWGWCCLLVGLTRLIALVVNGSFHRFHHSPHIRSGMACLSCLFWFLISFGLASAPQAATGLAVYPALLALDAWNAIRVARDARLADEAARARARRT